MTAGKPTNGLDVNPGGITQGRHPQPVPTVDAQDVYQYLEAVAGACTMETLLADLRVSKPRLKTLLHELERADRVVVEPAWSHVYVAIPVGDRR
jgi:hypothetical protein